MIGRIVRSDDFERVLAAPSRARSTHFAVHHLDARPGRPGDRRAARAGGRQAAVENPTANAARKAVEAPVDDKLSTGAEPASTNAVDDCVAQATEAGAILHSVTPFPGSWLGTVVPKRHARRSVTRSLLKRHIRAAAMRLSLPNGLWVVRLRAPFARDAFASAASAALGDAVRVELDALLASALQAPSRPARSPSGPRAKRGGR